MSIIIRRILLVFCTFQIVGCSTLSTEQEGRNNGDMGSKVYTGPSKSEEWANKYLAAPYVTALNILILPIVIPMAIFDALQPRPPESPRKYVYASASPPKHKYQAIDSYHRCLDVRPANNQKEWCMPFIKPANCGSTSWRLLNELQDGDKVLNC